QHGAGGADVQRTALHHRVSRVALGGGQFQHTGADLDQVAGAADDAVERQGATCGDADGSARVEDDVTLPGLAGVRVDGGEGAAKVEARVAGAVQDQRLCAEDAAIAVDDRQRGTAVDRHIASVDAKDVGTGGDRGDAVLQHRVAGVGVAAVELQDAA